MSGYTLTWKAGGEGQGPGAMGQGIDGASLRPDTLGVLDRDAVARVDLFAGQTVVTLGDLFDIAGEPGDCLTLRNTPPLDHLGALMQRGELIIEGDAGDNLGASMAGGLIRVHGSAGARVGGPHVTSRRGMSGGEILIDGNAGDFAGFLMRRGLIAIGGASGHSVGYRMIAGSIVLMQKPVDHPGLEMQRGSIVCLNKDALAGGGRHLIEGGVISAGAMPALLLVLRRLRELRWPVDGPHPKSLPGGEGAGAGIDLPRIAAGKWRLWSGDKFELNKGEVLQWLS
ncbi:MAG: hypothetical protein WD768_09490 [Phycisphaeraceae bacterium]